MKKGIVLGLIVSFGLAHVVFASENVSVQDHLVGGTFKTLAKAYVATADLKELKAKNVRRISIMRDERFGNKYAEVFAIARTLPAKVRTKYGITEAMTKDRAIAILKTMDKSRLYEIIDNIPDPVIADKFYEQLGAGGSGKESGNLSERISKAWERLVDQINKVPQPKASH